jgi:valyl-tRNA synthetase
MVVERKLAAEKRPDRRAMGRDKFLEEVWSWKAESGGTIVNQLKRLGASCDWTRERFTMDEGLSRAVLEVFVTLYKQGLIYRDKRLVNWDPKFQTAISDLEVMQVEVKGNLWHFDYPIEGSDEIITIATTRPETMLGDTAIAVHPENEKLKHLIGKKARLPLVGRLIPIVADDYADPEKGTGAVKITPAHDFNDFEVGKRHNLPLINIFDAEARLALRGNEAFLADANVSADLDAVLALHGADRFDARKTIIAMMEERGLLREIQPNVHTVPHGDRSNVVIEPWLTDQWYVDAKTMAQPALEAVRSGKTKFVPENWEKTYFQWLENIEPWCISRQLWWGHQIPAWYGPDGTVFVEKSEAEAKAAAHQHYGSDERLTRDEDVLDTWFSSALWPFSTLGWPDKTAELQRYYPTDVLVTGFDIIFFWVARMMMMGIHFMKEPPFHTVYIHALVRDEKGAKMSKSKGNVIDPLDLVDQYGADALRFTLAAMAAQGRDIKLATSRVEGYRNFATKIWNAARFAEMNGCARVAGFDPNKTQQKLNRAALTFAARAIADLTRAIEAYRFNDAANAAYRFAWNFFCDWYLELAKPILMGEDGPAKDETRAAIAYVFDLVLKMLHPFMPYLTEELWAVKGAEGPKRETILALASWPSDFIFTDEEAEGEIGWLVDLVTAIRSARNETNVPPGAQIPLVLVKASTGTHTRVAVWGDMLKRLARLSEVSFSDASPPESIGLVVHGESAALPLAGVVDIAAERARLTKEIEKNRGEITKIDAKLGNADFMKRAPEEVVEEQRERREDATQRVAKLEDALNRLG